MGWILEIGIFPKAKTSVLADDIDRKNKYIMSKDHCVVPTLDDRSNWYRRRAGGT
jgi:hypothetical protein